MANRSYIYLKMEMAAQPLTEGIYTHLYFWQLLDEDESSSIALWKTAEELEEDEEQAERFLPRRECRYFASC